MAMLASRKKVCDVMTPNPETIAPSDPVRRAAERMRSLDVGSLPVCEDGRLIGIVTDRDIAMRVVADGKSPDAPVREACSGEPRFARDTQKIEEAEAIMKEHQIRRLPVLDAQDRLVGMLALADLACAHAPKLDTVLEKISEPTHSHVH